MKKHGAGLSVMMASLFLMTAGFVRAECPVADLSGNCFIDLQDFAVLADQWLAEYDLEDLATLADQWLTPAPPPSCATCLGDLDGDGWITFDDLFILNGLLATQNPIYPWDSRWNSCADMNQDKVINDADLTALTNRLMENGYEDIPCGEFPL